VNSHCLSLFRIVYTIASGKYFNRDASLPLVRHVRNQLRLTVCTMGAGRSHDVGFESLPNMQRFELLVKAILATDCNRFIINFEDRFSTQQVSRAQFFELLRLEQTQSSLKVETKARRVAQEYSRKREIEFEQAVNAGKIFLRHCIFHLF
jgi:hypothetical protein